jgi:hypothetical protein
MNLRSGNIYKFYNQKVAIKTAWDTGTLPYKLKFENQSYLLTVSANDGDHGRAQFVLPSGNNNAGMSQTNRPSGSGTGWAIGSNLFAKNDVNFLFNNFLNNLSQIAFSKKKLIFNFSSKWLRFGWNRRRRRRRKWTQSDTQSASTAAATTPFPTNESNGRRRRQHRWHCEST